jgi:hypothetical protein
MLNQIRRWFTPKAVRIARQKRHLEKLLAEAGVSRSKRKRFVSDFYSGITDH